MVNIFVDFLRFQLLDCLELPVRFPGIQGRLQREGIRLWLWRRIRQLEGRMVLNGVGVKWRGVFIEKDRCIVYSILVCKNCTYRYYVICDIVVIVYDGWFDSPDMCHWWTVQQLPTQPIFETKNVGRIRSTHNMKRFRKSTTKSFLKTLKNSFDAFLVVGKKRGSPLSFCFPVKSPQRAGTAPHRHLGPALARWKTAGCQLGWSLDKMHYCCDTQHRGSAEFLFFLFVGSIFLGEFSLKGMNQGVYTYV